MIVFIIILVILTYLGIGTFALLSWQTASIIWAQPIVFVLGCLALILAGVSIAVLIITIKEIK